MSLDQGIIEVQTRQETGKGIARKLRKQAKVPGVLYGLGKEPVALSVVPDDLRKALKTSHGLNTVLTLNFDQGSFKRMAMLKDWQKEVLSAKLMHVDFVEVSLDRPVRVKVPIQIQGKAKGLIEGGILEFSRHEVTLECLPEKMPTHVDLDVTELGVGHSFHISDLKLPEGVKAVAAQNFTIVGVVGVAEEKVTAKPAEAAAAPVDAKAKAAPAAKDSKK